MSTPNTRWMSVLEGALALGLIATVAAGLFHIVMAVMITIGRPAWGLTLPAAETGVRIHTSGQGLLVGPLYLLAWLPGIVVGALALWWLYRILARGRTNDEELFSASTVTALRRVGWTLVVGTLAAFFLTTVGQSVIVKVVLADSDPISPTPLSVVTLMAGIAALAVSEVVNRGLALLEDVKATI